MADVVLTRTQSKSGKYFTYGIKGVRGQLHIAPKMVQGEPPNEITVPGVTFAEPSASGGGDNSEEAAAKAKAKAEKVEAKAKAAAEKAAARAAKAEQAVEKAKARAAAALAKAQGTAPAEATGDQPDL